MTNNKTITLKRLNHNEPDFPKLEAMIAALQGFLQVAVNPSDSIWMTNLETIIEFQAEDGSFQLFDTYRVPLDARVDFCHMPTYLCAAILMKAYMVDESLIGEPEVLTNALKACTHRGLAGHGYDGFTGLVKALHIFMEAGVREFLMYHRDLCPRFTEMMDQITKDLRERENQGNFLADWNEDFKLEILPINHYFSHCSVFVYGTLLQGENNHDYFLEDNWFISRAVVLGFDMYDIGYYPGIISGKGRVMGELYEVPKEAMKSLDSLEGEGSLYIRRCVQATKESGEKVLTSIYIYNNNVDGLEIIPEFLQPYTAEWQDGVQDYVWYVSYGSNMLKERFIHYIEGGCFEEGGACHKPCKDTSAPLAVRQYDIPYDMYFRNCSSSWGGQGVSFLDTTKEGYAKGVAYLITREQFEHVACQENGGYTPEESHGWYDTVETLGTMEGYEVVTITNNVIENYNRPSDAYIEVLCRGLQENYPEMTTAQIVSYLVDCGYHSA